MINLPDFDQLANKFMKENVIRESHYHNYIVVAMQVGWNEAIKQCIEQNNKLIELMHNQRKNNIT
jgi:hypothetical protein